MYGARRPIVAGELSVRGLEKPVVIRRDKFGVPHIDAETDHDAAFALGFVQAQDRAGQLEVYQRIVRGTLAELVGPPGLPADRLTRRLGFRRAAVEHVPRLDADVRSFLDAFAAGVNAGQQDGSKQWPHEFAILNATPSPWDAADVMAYVKFMSFQLPSNWDVELARWIMLREDGPAAVMALDPAAPALKGDSVEGARAPAGLATLEAELKALEAFAPRGGGSNNWVVAGSRSASGQPMLAGDPHLGPTLPNPWYLAHVRTPTWSVAGAMFAGSPVFPIAHNGFACWSVTAGLTDNTDLFLETLSDDGKKARQPDGTWIDCEIVRETIRVKGGADEVVEVAITPRGPIVTPLIPGEKQAISLNAVWLQPRRMRGFFDALRAQSFAEFRAPFADWPLLPLNVLYADEGGTIGYQLTGDLPVRGGGIGFLPTPVSRGDWASYVPFEQMPTTTNPDAGFLATANSDPHSWCPTVPNPPHLGFDYIDPYRAETIREELAKRTDWSVPAFQQLQLNLRSKPWEAIRETILALSSNEPHAALALEQLREWDGQIAADSPAAAIYETFLAEMCVRTAKAKAPNCWQLALGGNGDGPFAHSLLADRRFLHLVHLLLAQPAGWFARTWPEEMLDALGAAVRRLREEAGPSPPYWAWGHRRMLRLRHPLFGKHWLLGRVFNIGPVPMAGDANTIAQAGCRPLTLFDETHNFPNLRTAFDTANWSNCRFALAGGQSGNPCSPHFADQFPLWQRGEGIPIAWTSDEVIKSAVSSLRLLPTA